MFLEFLECSIVDYFYILPRKGFFSVHIANLGLVICFISLKLLFSLLQGTSCFVEKRGFCLGFRPFCASRKIKPKISCAMNMSAHQSDDDRKMQLNQLIDKARKLWDSSPEPVKNFPWNTALGNFIQLVLALTLAVVKYLAVPVFAVTCISELSYCAHQRKLFVFPIPVLLGAAVAGILKDTALELSPRLRVKPFAVPHFII